MLDWLKWKQLLINEYTGLGINRFKILITGLNHLNMSGRKDFDRLDEYLRKLHDKN
ncbi:hypothetical protein GCM10009865_05630 [Aeromicrobium ponti]